jgi:hypothetical protein
MSKRLKKIGLILKVGERLLQRPFLLYFKTWPNFSFVFGGPFPGRTFLLDKNAHITKHNIPGR